MDTHNTYPGTRTHQRWSYLLRGTGIPMSNKKLQAKTQYICATALLLRVKLRVVVIGVILIFLLSGGRQCERTATFLAMLVRSGIPAVANHGLYHSERLAA